MPRVDAHYSCSVGLDREHCDDRVACDAFPITAPPPGGARNVFLVRLSMHAIDQAAHDPGPATVYVLCMAASTVCVCVCVCFKKKARNIINSTATY
eukprot:SAG31_NODE_240_length_19407_cov_29.686140_6_plen_96_part_00